MSKTPAADIFEIRDRLRADLAKQQARKVELERERGVHLARIADPDKAVNARVHLVEVTDELDGVERNILDTQSRLAKFELIATDAENAAAQQSADAERDEAIAAIKAMSAENVEDAQALDAAILQVIKLVQAMQVRRWRAPELARTARLKWGTVERFLSPDLLELGAWGHTERAQINRELGQAIRIFAPKPPVAWVGGGGRMLTSGEYAALLSSGLHAFIAHERGELPDDLAPTAPSGKPSVLAGDEPADVDDVLG